MTEQQDARGFVFGFVAGLALMAVGFVFGAASNRLWGMFFGVLVGGLVPIATTLAAKNEDAAKGAAVAFSIVLIIFGGCTMTCGDAWREMGGR